MNKNLLLACALILSSTANAQKIGDFNSIPDGPRTAQLQLPATHTFQVLLTTGTLLSDGTLMGAFPDFTGYVPKNGSSTSGFLCVNSEALPGGVTVLDINYNPTTKLWEVTNTGNVSFLSLGTSGFNCSGGVTPWGTSITCEETYLLQDDVLPMPPPDVNRDGYSDLGWATEIDPTTKEVVDHDGDGQGDKLWALGRMKHENVAVAKDEVTVYEGVDDGDFGFIFKFMADKPRQLGSGKLFFLKAAVDTLGNFIGNGVWVQIPNASITERNTIQEVAASMGATNFRRVEDVEIAPNGDVYLAATSPGTIYRFTDNGTTVSGLGVFATKGKYPIQTASNDSAFFDKCDNLAFDCDGNLWVTEDGDAFHVWVLGPNHAVDKPNVRLFLIPQAGPNEPSGAVTGAEPTGITFSPDCAFGFMSFQRSNPQNRAAQPDASGQAFNFNLDPVIVFARKEVLGTGTVAVATKAAAIQDFQLYPNPANRIATIQFNVKKAQPLTIQITSPIGQVVGKQNFNGVEGENTIHFDTFLFPKGNYQVSVLNEQQLLISKTLLKFE